MSDTSKSDEPSWWSKQSRDVKGLIAAGGALTASVVVFWIMSRANGFDSVSFIGILAALLIIYGAVSGRITEFTGPGGWGAKFREAAAESVDPEAGILMTEMDEAQMIEKMGLSSLLDRVATLSPGKPTLLTVRGGRGEDYYQTYALADYLNAVRQVSGRTLLAVLDDAGRLVATGEAAHIAPILQGHDGQGQDFIDHLNSDSIDWARSHKALTTKRLRADQSSEAALVEMFNDDTDLLVVVDAQDKPVGVVERDKLVARLVLKLTKAAQ